MRFIDKLMNNKLRLKEKFSNSYYRQLLRLGKMLVKSPVRSLNKGVLKAMVGLTYDCQCKCNYCCTGLYLKEKTKELSTEEIRTLIDELSCSPSLFTLISFFGGEPLLREDVFNLVEYATKKGLFTETETNGILLSAENVKKLKKTGLHHIFVRIESCIPELHDTTSSFEGCFKSAIDGIKYCVAENLSCSISTIATKEKVCNGEIKEIINLARKLRATSVRILYPTSSGNWLKEKNQLLSVEEKNKVKELLSPGFVYLESTYVYSKELDRICPSKQKKMFYISCYGEVQPCPFVPLTFGNIRYKKINEILDTMWRYSSFNDINYNGCLMDDLEFRNQYIDRGNIKTQFPAEIV